MPFKSYLADNPPPAKEIPKKRYRRKHVRAISDLERRPAKRGSLTHRENFVIDAIVRESPGELLPAQIEATAIALNRRPATIADALEKARAKLQDQAEKYVDIHLQAVEDALADRDQDTARKGAEWYLEKISARDSSGKSTRIIEASSAESSAPSVRIGIALGGLPIAPPSKE